VLCCCKVSTCAKDRNRGEASRLCSSTDGHRRNPGQTRRSRPAEGQELRGVSWPIARHGELRGRAPLSTASDGERHRCANCQPDGLDAAVLLQGHAREHIWQSPVRPAPSPWFKPPNGGSNELIDDEWTAINPMLANKPRGVPRVNHRRVPTIAVAATWLSGPSTRSSSVVESRRAAANSPPTTLPSSNLRRSGYGCALMGPRLTSGSVASTLAAQR
jgi:hypothetical protein